MNIILAELVLAANFIVVYGAQESIGITLYIWGKKYIYLSL